MCHFLTQCPKKTFPGLCTSVVKSTITIVIVTNVNTNLDFRVHLDANVFFVFSLDARVFFSLMNKFAGCERIDPRGLKGQ